MNNELIAVIDTETNWHDQVMSVGMVIADASFRPVEKVYCIISPECNTGGFFSSALHLSGFEPDLTASRTEVMSMLVSKLNASNVSRVFAYNANFDYGHLPELHGFRWFDIMGIAAYRQFNSAIPDTADCCKSGRLKRSYGVEPMFRLLSDNQFYHEKHNALADAIDELEIMRLLGHVTDVYLRTEIL